MRNKDFTWREYRTNTIMFSQIPIFVNTNITKTPTYRHHLSMYGFCEEDASLQKRLGNTKNRKVQHYSSELIIDTDNAQTAEKVWVKLCGMDYQFEMWKLNNYKFFLQRDEADKPSETMVYQDRQWVKESFYDCVVNKGLDTGIYSSPFHLIRGRNAIHEITGAKSVLIETNKGSNFVSTSHVTVIPKEISYDKYDVNISDWGQFQHVIEFAQGKAVNKHLVIWQFGRDMSKHCSYQTGLELALIYAKSIDYDEKKAERAYTQAYSEVRKSA